MLQNESHVVKGRAGVVQGVRMTVIIHHHVPVSQCVCVWALFGTVFTQGCVDMQGSSSLIQCSSALVNVDWLLRYICHSRTAEDRLDSIHHRLKLVLQKNTQKTKQQKKDLDR